MPGGPGILFTAFEPSGDTLAAPIIAELRRRRPGTPVWALGGPRMREAGAEVLEATTAHAVMLAGAAGQAWTHRRRLRRLAAWLREGSTTRPLLAHVPTDSPAANWSICKLVQETRPAAKVVHLAAPQLWAWAPGRIRKLRRLTDHVLCLLPFEPAWFAARGVPATFVGHPIFDRLRASPPEAGVVRWPVGGPRLALLPGSRAGELRRNLPTMLAAYARLRGRWGGLCGVFAAVDAAAAERVRAAIAASEPATGRLEGINVGVGQTDAVLAAADAVLVVSGTATLQVAAHRKPMVILYNVSRGAWHLAGRWLVQTRTFTLPNLIAEADGLGRIVPELVPHFGDPAPVAEAVGALLADPAAAGAQVRGLEKVCGHFTGVSFAETATDRLLGVIERDAGATPAAPATSSLTPDG